MTNQALTTNPIPSRRSVLAGLGIAAAAAPMAVLPAFAADHPDAELLRLGEQFREIAARVAEAYDVQSKIYHDVVAANPPPDELILRSEDPDLGVPLPHYDQGRGMALYHPPGDFSWTAGVAMKAWPRMAEIVVAWGKWDQEFKAALDAAGHDDDNMEANRIQDEELAPIGEAILETPATTIEGMAVKLRVVTWWDDGMDGEDDDDPETFFANRMQASIRRDIKQFGDRYPRQT